MNRSNISAKLGCVFSLALLISACGGGGGGGKTVDRSPDPVSFADGNIANAVPGFIYMSPAVLVNGIDAGETIAAAVEGGEISVNGAAFAAGPADVVQGDALRLRAAAPGAFEDSVAVTLALGDASNAEWHIATPASVLELSVSPKRLDFSWSAMTGAERFELHVNPDGASGFTKTGLDIAADVTAASIINLPVHLTDWHNAVYQLQACRGDMCVTLPGHEVGLEQAQSVVAIGKLKLPFPSVNDSINIFGEFAMNGDGTLLAVGVAYEDVPGFDADGVPSPEINPDANYGAVYLFQREAEEWISQKMLRPAGLHEGEKFGSAVSLTADGQYLAVGAEGNASPGVDADGNPLPPDASVADSGAIYLFRFIDREWQQHGFLKASNVSADDRLGGGANARGLAWKSDGSMLIVMSVYDDSPGLDATGGLLPDDGTADQSGAVFVFENTTTGWQLVQVLKHPDPQSLDYFGYPLAMDTAGTLLTAGSFFDDSPGINAAGALLPDDGTADDSGAAFAYSRTATGWELEAVIKAPIVRAGDGFGTVGMSANGEWLGIGTSFDDSPGVDGAGSLLPPDGTANQSGAVHLYRRTAGGWTWQQALKAPKVTAGDYFGAWLLFNHDATRLFINAEDDSAATGVFNASLVPADNNANNTGSIVLFQRNDTGDWSATAVVKGPLPINNVHFPGNVYGGWAIDSKGETLVAPFPDDSAKSGNIENLIDDCDAPVAEQVNCLPGSDAILTY